MKNFYKFFSASVCLLILSVYAKYSIVYADQDAFQKKCTKCHSARIPDNYTKKEWKYNVERMAERAGLTSEEIQSIVNLNTKN